MKAAVGNQASGGVAKCLAILAAISLACRALISVFTGERAPDYIGGTGRFAGEIIGGGIAIFVAALFAFSLARFVRRSDQDAFAGLLSGTLAAFAIAILMFIGSP